MPVGSGPRTATRGDDNGHPNPPATGQRQSAFDAVGQGFLAFYEDDEDDDDEPPRQNHSSAGQYQPPSSNHSPPDRHHHQQQQQQQQQRPPLQQPQPPQQYREPPPPQRVEAHHQEHEPRRPPVNGKVPMPIMVHPVPRPPPATFMKSPPPQSPQLPPMSPHPLQPPKVPIAPALLVPKNSPRASMVKFAPAILRGNTEETLLSKTTPKGAEFWRRFSFVVKEESKPDMKRSSWVMKNQSRFSRMRVCIWLVTIVILIALGGTGTLVWWLTRDTPALQPKSLGGSANIANDDPATKVTKPTGPTSSPLRTVAGMTGPTEIPVPTIGTSTLLPGAAALDKRTAFPAPGPTANPLAHRRRRKDRRMVYH